LRSLGYIVHDLLPALYINGDPILYRLRNTAVHWYRIQGAPKSNPYFSGIVVNFFRKIYCAYQRRIQTTYAANFIAIFGCIQKYLNLNVHFSK